jgi:hypothetical protein
MDIFKIVPPIFGRVACPFLPHKRTSTSTVGMSATGQELTHAPQQKGRENPSAFRLQERFRNRSKRP